MKVHPALEPFPELLEPDVARLAIDIRDHGLLSPLVRCDAMLLDGRARLVACERVKVKARFIDYTGDPFVYAMRVNGGRAMTPGQRAIVAGELYRAKRVSQDTLGVSQDTGADAVTAHAIGEAMGVSRITVFRAVRLLASAPADVIDSVRRGDTQITVAFREHGGGGARKQRRAPEGLIAIASSVEKMERRLTGLRDEVHELCVNVRARKLLEDTLLDVTKDLYAIADGSAYPEARRA